MTTVKNPEATWFGDREVDPAEKTSLVREVFTSVAQSYDLMNDCMSLGIHRAWKHHFVARVAPKAGEAILDVAGGTGDIALRLANKAPDAKINVCDLNPAMIEVGRDSAIDRGKLSLEWTVGNAQALPYPDNSFDVYTIAFGLRNVTEIDTALSEAFRVLRPGGRFYCLEFSHVTLPGLEQVYGLYSKVVIPAMGSLIAKDRESYEYLVESIRRFPKQEELAARMEIAGFELVKVENLTGGIAAIHRGYKL